MTPVPNPAHPFITDAHFRQWDWANKFSWTKHIHIPFGHPAKYAGNPIMSGRAGLFDQNGVYMPNLVRYGDITYMSYEATNPANRNQVGIAKASSVDFPITWTRYANPIVPLGAAGAWDERNIVYSCMMLDEDDELYRIYYAGTNNALVSRLGLSTCPLASDPTVPANWTKDAGNPLWAPANFYSVGGILRLGNLFYLQFNYSAFPRQLRCATSNDGRTGWIDRGIIVPVGAGGAWDDNETDYASMFWSQGLTYSLYSASDGANWRIGITLASNDLLTYVKYFDNPTIGLGAGGTWEATHVAYPSIIMVDDVYYVFYVGFLAAYQIGYATIP